jgi:hypothetical protein
MKNVRRIAICAWLVAAALVISQKPVKADDCPSGEGEWYDTGGACNSESCETWCGSAFDCEAYGPGDCEEGQCFCIAK